MDYQSCQQPPSIIFGLAYGKFYAPAFKNFVINKISLARPSVQIGLRKAQFLATCLCLSKKRMVGRHSSRDINGPILQLTAKQLFHLERLTWSREVQLMVNNFEKILQSYSFNY